MGGGAGRQFDDFDAAQPRIIFATRETCCYMLREATRDHARPIHSSTVSLDELPKAFEALRSQPRELVLIDRESGRNGTGY